jgi:two-component sensor histidine kinase
MTENAQHFRSHMQRVVSLLNLHIQYQDSANIPDFVRKLRMRIELMAEGFPLAVEMPEREAPIAEAIEAVANIVSRVYDPDGSYSVDYAIDDLSIDPATLATLGQIFAEFLSNLYSRTPPGGAPNRATVKLLAGPASRVTLTVRDVGSRRSAQPEPVDLLTSRVIVELAKSLGGEARFNGDDIYDARLSFPMAAPPR